MNDYNNSNSIDAIIEEIFALPTAKRIALFQKLFFAFITHDRTHLIPLAYEAGVPVTKIASTLGVDASLIYRDYLKKGDSK